MHLVNTFGMESVAKNCANNSCALPENGYIYLNCDELPSEGVNEHCQRTTDQDAAKPKDPNGTDQAADTGKAVDMSTRNMEPIMINDYTGMNYFTQVASNVTIYLNDKNLLNQPAAASHGQQVLMDGDNWYYVDQDGVIDLTKSSDFRAGACKNGGGELPYKIVNVEELTETAAEQPAAAPAHDNDILKRFQYLNIVQGKDEDDSPEYIDLNSLELPVDLNRSPADDKPSKKTQPAPAFLKKKRQTRSTASTVTRSTSTNNEDDDDVIFVKEYKAEDPLDLCCQPSTSKDVKPEPRRNPKRQVQLLKESYDLAMKLSDGDIYYDRNRRTLKEFCGESSRRSSRNTGAVFSPPAALTNQDYKEWPAEAMHERPVFNNVTKKVAKFDFKKPAKNKAVAKTKNVVPKAPKKAPNKVQKKRSNASKSKEDEENERKDVNKEFAALTHDTLQHVMDYVAQVKEYNTIMQGKRMNRCKTQENKNGGSLADKCKDVLEEISNRQSNEKNLFDAADLLRDTSLVYCLANNVTQDSLAEYLNNSVTTKED